MRLVQSAVQRAFEATVSSSPRTHMMTTQPTSGSQVSSDRMREPGGVHRRHPNTKKMATRTTTPISITKA